MRSGLLRFQPMVKQIRRAVPVRASALAIVVALGVGGCGVKGPLVPAPKTPPAAPDSAAPAAQDASKAERKP
jgi:predicted small lipoprotein YifL